MKKILNALTLVALLSMPALAAGDKQKMEEGTGTGQDFEQWQEEALESEQQDQQLEEDFDQQEQEMVDPGHDLYEEEEFEEEDY
jgi:Spy/CpxP family protein refolding chaperone